MSAVFPFYLLSDPVLEYGIVPETEFLQKLRRVIKFVTEIFRLVRVGADGDEFSAEFTVASENIGARIRFAETVPEPAGVDLKAFAVFNQKAQDRVDKVCVGFVRVVFVAVRTVADDIVHVPERIKGCRVALLQRFVLYTEKLLVAIALRAPVEIRRIVGIHAVQVVQGGDDKIERVLPGQAGKRFRQMRLDAELHADADPNPTAVLFPQLQHPRKIFIEADRKNTV